MSLGARINSLRVDDRLDGKVTERLPSGDLIVGFDGELLRVANASGRVFKVGDQIRLVVRTVKPLQLQVLSSEGPGRFHVLG